MPNLTTALLVRYRGGYVEVTSGESTYGRREALVQIDVGSAEQASSVGDQILALIAHEQTTNTVEVFGTVAAPMTRPWFGFRVGDYIAIPSPDLSASSQQRVVAMTLSSNGDSLRYVPEIGDAPAAADAEIQRIIRRMNVGSLGQAAAAVPTRAQHPVAGKHQPKQESIPFSLFGPLIVSTSSRWYIRRAGKAVKITSSLNTAGTSDTMIDVNQNGSSFVTITMGNAVDQVATPVQQSFAVDDYVTVTITSVGTGPPSDLTVQVDFQDESDPAAN